MANLHDNRGFPSVCMEISNHKNHFALAFSQVGTKIAAYFADLRIGCIKDVSLNRSPNGEFMCTVIFDKWYRNPAADHLREKILSGRPARLVYDDPYSWELKWAVRTDYAQFGLWNKIIRIQSWWRTYSAVMAYEIQLAHKRGLYQTQGGEWMWDKVAGEDATTKKSETASYPSVLSYPSDFTQADIQCADAGRPSPGQGWMPTFSYEIDTGSACGMVGNSPTRGEITTGMQTMYAVAAVEWSGIKMEAESYFQSCGCRVAPVLEFDRTNGCWNLQTNILSMGVLCSTNSHDWLNRDGWMHEVGSVVTEDRRIASRELCDNE